MVLCTLDERSVLPSAHSDVRHSATSNTADCWNADGRLLHVYAKCVLSYPMCVRLCINFLTKGVNAIHPLVYLLTQG